MSTNSAGRIVKHLIAKNGPLTTQKLFEYVPTFEKEFISKTHLKTKILKGLENEGVLHKKINHSSSSKPVWEWTFTDKQVIDKYKELY